MKNIFNIIGFQLSWWACVLGVKYGYSYLGPLLMFLFIVIHFSIFKSQISELKLIILFAFIGTIIDTAIANTGILIYNGSYSQDLLIAPLWITAMWCGFCATINHSLSWLKEKWALCVLMGAIFGPLSYIAGEKFEAISFQSPFLTVNIVLAIVWGISIPLIFFFNSKIQ